MFLNNFTHVWLILSHGYAAYFNYLCEPWSIINQGKKFYHARIHYFIHAS